MIKKNKRINEYWPYAQDTIPSSGDSRYPVNTEGEFTVWSEQTTAADGGWEIYCQRNDEDPINISNTPNVNSRFSHASRRLTLGNDYLYTAWTEGNAAPYRVLIEKTRFPVEHETLIAFSSVNVGQVQPSIYTVERTGYIQSWGHPVDYGDSILIYHFPHLNPEMIYEVEPEFYHEGGGIWIAKVYVNGNYMGLISYSPGILQKERFLLPPDIYQEGEMTVRLEKVAGDMVTVAGFNVYRFEQGGDVGGGPMSSGAGEGNNIKPTMRVKPTISRGEIEIQLTLPKEGKVKINIYDVTGRQIYCILNKKLKTGSYKFEWDGEDQEGQALPNGVYFIQLENITNHLTQKVILLR